MLTQRFPAVRANYAYSQSSVVDEMAKQHRVHYNPHSIAGMPRDTFRQSRVLTSSRQYVPPSKGSVFAKQFGSFLRDLGTIAKVVGFFVPPVGAVAAVASPITSMVGSATDQINTNPRALQVNTVGRYNYWFR